MTGSDLSSSRPRSRAYFEAALFARLPGNVLVAGLGLFVAALGVCLGLATLLEPGFLSGARGDTRRFLLFILVQLAIPVIALTAERWAQRRLAVDAAGALAPLDAPPRPLERRALWIASMIGAALGLGSITLFVLFDLRGDWAALVTGTEVFPALLMLLIFVLLGRAIARSLDVSARVRRLCAAGLAADPLRPEPMHAFGRIALRQASVWFALALAMFALLLLGLRGLVFQLIFATTVLAGALTFWSLIRPPGRVLAAARQSAIAHVRDRMSMLRGRAFDGDGGAAASYSALATEEIRLERASDWPVSAPVTRSLLVFGAGPAIAWFGAALAERIVSALTGA